MDDIALVGAVFLWVWLGVDPLLRYQYGCPSLVMDSDTWHRFLSRPGGFIEGLATLAAQLDRFPIIAAGLFAAVAGLVGWAVRAASGLAGRARALAWLPGLGLLLVYSQYGAPALEHAGGILLAVSALTAWTHLAPAATAGRIALAWLVGALVFYLGGTVPCWLFVAGAGASEALRKRNLAGAAAGWLAAVIVPVGWSCFPEADAGAVWRRWGSGLPWVLAWIAYGLTIAMITLGIWLARPTASAAAPVSSPARPPRRVGRLKPRWRLRGTALLVPVAALALAGTFDVQQRTHLHLLHAGEMGRWRDILAILPKLTATSAADRLLAHRALFHSGRLCDDLFTVPHSRSEELLPSLEAGLEAYPVLSDTLLELGHINLAERYAHEALESRGERPETLRRLARINVLKERPAAARVFLGRLAKMPFERAWAASELHALATDLSLASDPVIAAIRPVRFTGQLTEARFTSEMLLTETLKANPTNRMAFEYLVAHRLLTGQPEAVLDRLGDFNRMGFTALPRHVSEAILLHQKRHPESPVKLAGWQIPDAIAARWQQYVAAINRAGVGSTTLAQQFGDTYWYYAQMGGHQQ